MRFVSSRQYTHSTGHRCQSFPRSHRCSSPFHRRSCLLFATCPPRTYCCLHGTPRREKLLGQPRNCMRLAMVHGGVARNEDNVGVKFRDAFVWPRSRSPHPCWCGRMIGSQPYVVTNTREISRMADGSEVVRYSHLFDGLWRDAAHKRVIPPFPRHFCELCYNWGKLGVVDGTQSRLV